MKPASFQLKRSLLFPLSLLLLLHPGTSAWAQHQPSTRSIPVAEGWARNSINAVSFRKNSLTSFRDTQFVAYYDPEGFMVLGKRRSGQTNWLLKRTPYQGNTSDAHNSISIEVDGNGFLHVAWDHHNNALRYCRSISPGSLELTSKMPMTGDHETKVTYPEFYRFPNGDLLFLYRDGSSGNGNLVVKKYDHTTAQWYLLHQNLIDGEGKRNAYWQACIDKAGTIHISWVWRESPDVASNHDMCYARSKDGGRTWERSDGEKYVLPVNAATAEYAWRIPESSELINQTSMCTDENGSPVIATYWRDSGTAVPQYHLLYLKKNKWEQMSFQFRKTSFSLSGAGSKRIPISRPQVLVKGAGTSAEVFLIFRDEERGNRVSVAGIRLSGKKKIRVFDLADEATGSWEPTYDPNLWKEKNILSLFVQNVEQADAEGTSNLPPQMIRVLEWIPGKWD
jgi:hypothetical protein